MKTAALVVIGDEILTGKVKDDNSFVFAKLMFERGVHVESILVIPDDRDTIAESVRSFTRNYDYVCTSGGIGPTHDDITFEGVALGMGKPLAKNSEAIAFFKAAQERAGRGSQISDVQLKMLAFPSPCEVYFVEPFWLPMVRVDNLFILPGVPSLFEKLLTGWAHLFEGGHFFRELLYTDRTELNIAHALGQIQAKYSGVKIGSYPQAPGKTYNVMVSIEGSEQSLVKLVAHQILELIDGRRSAC